MYNGTSELSMFFKTYKLQILSMVLVLLLSLSRLDVWVGKPPKLEAGATVVF